MRRPDKIQVYAIKARKDRAKQPWIVRWKVNGKESSRSFPTKAAGEDFRARILVSARDGHRFDPSTGLPAEWTGSTDSFAEYCAAWVERQWKTWAPRSRHSALEALVRAIPLMVPARAPEPPENIRSYLASYLASGPTSEDVKCDAWLRRWSLPLADLTAEVAARAHAELGIRDDGQPAAKTTADRYRITAHAVLLDAVAKEKLAKDPWPPPRKSRRRVEKRTVQINTDLLPSQDQVRQIIAAVPSPKAGSRNYWLLSQISWFLGTRPSEAIVLRAEDLTLPTKGWGNALIHRAADGDGGVGHTKTGVDRNVPIPPELLSILRHWLEGRTEGPLVITSEGNSPNLGNWGRALDRACRVVGHRPINPYDLRHCCATMMLAAGVAPGEAARRLGHSVQTLMTHYAGVMTGDEETANQRIEAAFSPG